MLEPQPIVFKQYLTKIHGKRKEILPINAAVSENNGKPLLYTLAFSKERWATGLSSFNKAVLLEKIKDGNANRENIYSSLKENSDAKYMFLITVKDIKAGQEVTANYNLYTYPKTGVGIQMI